MEKYHTVAPDTDFCISGKPQTDDRDYMLRDVTRTQGMQEVKKGNLDVLVQIQSFDEIDTITDNFKVTMFFIKKEKKESYEITFISDEISIGRYLYYLCCIYLLQRQILPYASGEDIFSNRKGNNEQKGNQGCRRVLLYSENYSAYIKRYP